MRKSLALSKRSESNGFTLVELLIVMGVLAVLVVTILISLNPAEAQKKARDVKRMKDMATLEAIINQYIMNGGEPFCSTAWCVSTNNSGKTDCADNWIRYADGSAVNFCDYTKTLPIDPLNGKRVSHTYMLNGAKYIAQPPTDIMMYRIRMKGSDYKINSYQESLSNAANPGLDGGIDGGYVEIGSDLTMRNNE